MGSHGRRAPLQGLQLERLVLQRVFSAPRALDISSVLDVGLRVPHIDRRRGMASRYHQGEAVIDRGRRSRRSDGDHRVTIPFHAESRPTAAAATATGRRSASACAPGRDDHTKIIRRLLHNAEVVSQTWLRVMVMIWW